MGTYGALHPGTVLPGHGRIKTIRSLGNICTDYVDVQSTLRAHAYRVSHNSSVRLCRIVFVYTLHAAIHQWV